MKSFQDYVSLKELAAYDVGMDLLGRSSLTGDSQSALAAALEGIEVLLATPAGTQVIAILNRMAPMNQDLQGVLKKHGMDSFKDASFRSNLKRAASKGRKVITKGLADVSPDDVKGGADVIAAPAADSHHNPLG